MATATDTATTLTPEQEGFIASGKLLRALARDPKYRPRVLGLIKEAAPDVDFPELRIAEDAERRATEAAKPDREKVTALEKEIQDLKRTIERSIFAGQEGLDEEEVVEIEELAKKHELKDASVAAELWRARNPQGRASRPPAADDYLSKIRKINPRDQRALKDAALAEGTRIYRELRRARRA